MRRGTYSAVVAASLCAALAMPAAAQTVMPGPLPSSAQTFQRLFTNVVASGNGADTTEDTLTNCSTYVLPAGQLANVGDAIHIIAGGTLANSTDAKNARVKLGGTTLMQASGATVTTLTWLIDVWTMKRGPNQQVSAGAAQVNNSAITVGNNNGQGFNDTGTLAITVTGTNATNPVSNSVTCSYITVDFVRGS